MIRRPPRSTRTDHSFPTRRSSDLLDIHRLQAARERSVLRIIVAGETDGIALGVLDQFLIRERHRLHLIERKAGSICTRSDEHTSELKSLMRISYAVSCLKKKTPHQTHSKLNTLLHLMQHSYAPSITHIPSR